MRSSQVVLVLAGLLGTMPLSASAQDRGIPQDIVATTRPLNSEQVETIRTFADRWSQNLASDDVAAVSRARAELIQPPSRPGASALFQGEYATLLLPVLTTIIDGEDEYRAVNALIVVRSLRTPAAVDTLIRFSDPRKEQRTAVRLRAAGLIGDTVNEASMTPAQVDGAVRSVAAAAAVEPDWIGVLHGFNALARIASQPRLPEGSVALAHNEQVATLRSAVERLDRDGAQSGMMEAISRCLLIVRDQLVTMTPSAAANFRLRLAPVLGKVITVAENQWATAQSDPAARKAFGDAVSNSELLLKLVDPDVRSDLRVAWQKGDKSAFDQGVEAWNAALSRPPFSG